MGTQLDTFLEYNLNVFEPNSHYNPCSPLASPNTLLPAYRSVRMLGFPSL